jgi:hypothetical protein
MLFLLIICLFVLLRLDGQVYVDLQSMIFEDFEQQVIASKEVISLLRAILRPLPKSGMRDM